MSAHVGFDTELQQITITTFITIVELFNKFIWQFCLWIHNCYCYSPLHGACSELLDCQLFFNLY